MQDWTGMSKAGQVTAGLDSVGQDRAGQVREEQSRQDRAALDKFGKSRAGHNRAGKEENISYLSIPGSLDSYMTCCESNVIFLLNSSSIAEYRGVIEKQW
jgi:hypothetical protein